MMFPELAAEDGAYGVVLKKNFNRKEWSVWWSDVDAVEAADEKDLIYWKENTQKCLTLK